jgi:outer membrane autotransporter protein
VTFQGAREFENMWLSHLDDVMCGLVTQPQQPNQPDTQQPACHVHDQPAGWWMKTFGYFASQGNQGAYGGYNANIYGTMVAYDAPVLHMPIDGDTRVGLGIGYARSTINANIFGSTTDSNTYQATAYIAHEQGPWFLDGDLSFGWNDYSGDRNIVFPGVDRTAQSQYSGQDYTAFATTGYHLLMQGFTVTPLASLQYTHVDLGSYSESGAGSIDLNVQAQHYDFLESGLGVKVARSFQVPAGSLVPELHFKWLHELINPSMQNSAAFAVAGSPSFTTPGLREAPNTLDVGTGLTFLSCNCTAKTWSVEAVYDYFWRSDLYSANQVMLRFTARF